ncbi:hypothetical protein GTU79_16060 [Sodalis ligni]|uniref:hypothetical protein n=1 Tax=Sodalis ligni TaxID=2697027 RepID=UPI001BDE02D0|nr:hypothetical protein [Sodalis ligni]QWA09013.1 hypothetical protein GTU79_16060 [Sodalis ligni]
MGENFQEAPLPIGSVFRRNDHVILLSKPVGEPRKDTGSALEFLPYTTAFIKVLLHRSKMPTIMNDRVISFTQRNG